MPLPPSQAICGTRGLRTGRRPGAGLTVSGSRDASGHMEPAGWDRESQPGTKSRIWLQCARSSTLARWGSLQCPGWPATADGAAPDPHRDLGRWLADRFRASVPRSQCESHPPASRCGRSNERTRPRSVVAVAEKSRKAGAVRVWLAWVAGVGPRVRPAGVPGCGPHPARKSYRTSRQDPLALLVRPTPACRPPRRASTWSLGRLPRPCCLAAALGGPP